MDRCPSPLSKRKALKSTYLTTFLADGDGKSVWSTFAKDGRLSNSDTSWISASEKLAGAIAVRFTLDPGEK